MSPRSSWPRRVLWVGAIATLVAIGIVASVRSMRSSPSTADTLVPTTRVVRGSIELSVHSKGELRASKFATLQAPPMSGTLRLLTIVETGKEVKKGEEMMTFDPTELQYQLEQAESQLQEAEQTIIKLGADRDAQTAQDTFDLIQARFDVRRAELDARADKDLISPRDYQLNQLTLEEATRKLAQLQTTGSSRTETDRAALAAAEEKRSAAKNTVDRAKESLDNLVVKAPMDGFVVVRQNQDANNGFFYTGMSLPEYRAGDVVFSGRPVLDVFDISHMEIKGKVSEQQRNNLAVGQKATAVSDELPDARLTSTISAVSGQAQSDWFSESGPLRDFDLTLQLDQVDPRLRPGTSVQLTVAGKRVEHVLNVPRQAIFEQAGKRIVYVRHGDHFEPTAVTLKSMTEDRVAIDGVPEGAEVALVNPDAAARLLSKTASPAAGVVR